MRRPQQKRAKDPVIESLLAELYPSIAAGATLAERWQRFWEWTAMPYAHNTVPYVTHYGSFFSGALVRVSGNDLSSKWLSLLKILRSGLPRLTDSQERILHLAFLVGDRAVCDILANPNSDAQAITDELNAFIARTNNEAISRALREARATLGDPFQ